MEFTGPYKHIDYIVEAVKDTELRIKAATGLEVKLLVSQYHGQIVSQEAILTAAATLFGYTEPDILSSYRDGELTEIRHLCMFFAYTHIPKLKVDKIAKHFGRHRTTVIYAIAKMTGFMETKDPKFKKNYDILFNHFFKN